MTAKQYLIAFLAAALLAVPWLEYREWRLERNGFVMESGRITAIREVPCNIGPRGHRDRCRFASVTYRVSDNVERTFEATRQIDFDDAVGDSISILVSSRDRQRALLPRRRVVAFMGVPSLLAFATSILAFVAVRLLSKEGRSSDEEQ